MIRTTFLTAILCFAQFSFAGEPDVEFHEKCLYPTVMIQKVGEGGQGTGVIIKSVETDYGYENYVFSCAHVFEPSSPVYRRGPNGVLIQIKPQKYEYEVFVGKYENWSKFIRFSIYKCEVLFVNKETDTALVKFISKEKMYTARINAKPNLYIRNSVCKVGCGLGQVFRVDEGKITSLPNEKSGNDRFRTSCFTLPGDSGGPMFHEYELIGIVNAVTSESQGNRSEMIYHISHVIPMSQFMKFGEIKTHISD